MQKMDAEIKAFFLTSLIHTSKTLGPNRPFSKNNKAQTIPGFEI